MTNRNKKKGSPLLTLLLLVCIGVFCFSGYRLASIFLEYKAGTDEYKELRKYTAEAKEEKDGQGAGSLQAESAASEAVTEPPIQIDFAALRNINPDIVGWIYVGALDLSYPIVQGTDDEYYLHRTFEKKKNFSGSIFMGAVNHRDFQDPNTLIYGHNMKNGSMFGMLKHLVTKEKYKDNSHFWILTPEKNYRYQMFSLHETHENSDVYTVFSGADQQFLDFAGKMARESSVTLPLPQFSVDSKVVTLSTCTKDEESRFVVQGVLSNVIQ